MFFPVIYVCCLSTFTLVLLPASLYFLCSSQIRVLGLGKIFLNGLDRLCGALGLCPSAQGMVAVQGLAMYMKKGKVFALLGHNG